MKITKVGTAFPGLASRTCLNEIGVGLIFIDETDGYVRKTEHSTLLV